MPSYKAHFLISLVFPETKWFHHRKLASERYVFGSIKNVEIFSAQKLESRILKKVGFLQQTKTPDRVICNTCSIDPILVNSKKRTLEFLELWGLGASFCIIRLWVNPFCPSPRRRVKITTKNCENKNLT